MLVATGVNEKLGVNMSWEIKTLAVLLDKDENLAVSQEGDCLFLTSEHGIDAYVSLGGEQIIVESLLFAMSQVSNTAALNEAVLRSHKLFPLTTVGIVSVDGTEYYAAFGALSVNSSEDDIRLEIDFLFQNIEDMLDTYEEFIN
ncbi:hypothetical protein MNBD_GAMMA20-547 [hydrothermal vent metagenome]|uniref:Cytoplasmic protein n=1 Tax=hydrothermal vent metagenome TaxID=652676 RepID=A0A3B0ZZE3_9ZZZZ